MSFILEDHIVKNTYESIPFKRDTVILIQVVWDFPNDSAIRYKQWYKQ